MATRRALQIIKGAKAGVLAAQFELGCLYLNGGEGLPVNSAAALQWLGRAAGQGHEDAALMIGRRVDPASLAAPGDLLANYMDAARRGDAQAAVWAAELLLERDAEGDRERALELVRPAAAGGDPAAQVCLAELLSANLHGLPDEARRWFIEAAAAGSDRALKALADEAWRRHDPAGIPWLERVAGQGDPEAAYRLGILLREAAGRGVGVGKGEAAHCIERSRHWIGVAARAEHPAALYEFGRIAAGRVPGMRRRNYKLASRCLQDALAAGVADAAVELALLHGYKRFLGRAPELIFHILEEGARKGSMEAQYRLALILLKHRGEPEALYQAACWLNDAARAGHELASARLDRLVPAPSPASPSVRAYQDEVIAALRDSHCAIALRLQLMAMFGLRLYEMMYFDPAVSDRGFCLLFGLEQEVRRKTARLVRIVNAEQRSLLDMARRELFTPEAVRGDFVGAYKQRYQKLLWLGRRHGFDWDRFAGCTGADEDAALQVSHG